MFVKIGHHEQYIIAVSNSRSSTCAAISSSVRGEPCRLTYQNDMLQTPLTVIPLVLH